MTPDRRDYTERVNAAATALTHGGVAGGKGAAITALLVAGLPDLLDERAALQDALEEARARLDGRAWADLTADRDRYRGELRALLDDMAVVHDDDRLGYVDVQVSRAELADARKTAGSAS